MKARRLRAVQARSGRRTRAGELRLALDDPRMLGSRLAPRPGPTPATTLALLRRLLRHVLFTVRRDAVGAVDGAVDGALADLGLSRRAAVTVPHVLAVPPILAATDLVAAILGSGRARRVPCPRRPAA